MKMFANNKSCASIQIASNKHLSISCHVRHYLQRIMLLTRWWKTMSLISVIPLQRWNIFRHFHQGFKIIIILSTLPLWKYILKYHLFTYVDVAYGKICCQDTTQCVEHTHGNLMIVLLSWLIYSEQLGVDIKWNTIQSSRVILILMNFRILL